MDLKNMKKDDLIKLVEELKKELDSKEEIEQLEEDTEEQVEIDEEDREKINKLIDKAEAFIVCTDKGMMCYGTMREYMNILTHITDELSEEMPEKFIRFAVENGLRKVNSVEDALELLKDGLDMMRG